MADLSQTSNAPIYFHSITGEPLWPLRDDPDSESESRSSWHQEAELADIDEYDDLQPEDKDLFKTLSQLVRKNLRAPDRDMKTDLLQFLQMHPNQGKTFKVYLALLLHKNVLTGDEVYHVLLEMKKHAN